MNNQTITASITIDEQGKVVGGIDPVNDTIPKKKVDPREIHKKIKERFEKNKIQEFRLLLLRALKKMQRKVTVF